MLTRGLFVAPLTAQAQTPRKVPGVGYVFARVSSEDQRLREAARQGLLELGYVESQNITLEVRWAEGRTERLPDLVAELVRLKVDVPVVATTPGPLAAKNATRAIPIVFVAVANPVGSGLVSSLARPGDNLTGLGLLNPEISGKRLELLKESLPHMSPMAILTNPNNPSDTFFWRETRTAAQTLGLQLQSIKVRGPEEDREGARVDDPPIGAPASGSGYRMTDWPIRVRRRGTGCAPAPRTRAYGRASEASNISVERTAGSHSLAPAAPAAFTAQGIKRS